MVVAQAAKTMMILTFGCYELDQTEINTLGA